MKLSRLEMIGFKSFMNKTTIVFEDGITIVVGPNGCGKSNIVDAIFWVMGDQSPKHLRGNEMGDVIFAGSEEHPQSGMSEVHLTLSTEDGVGVPAQYSQFSEITVTRRLYRTGESEYLINKTPCRLRDVLELFMDSGVGAKSYSVIEQGDIGKIVTQKPQDRRAFIEEAAGIVKFKSRKHEAELKLTATEQNLLRLNDIIAEIKRQIDSLERQARKAERYKKLKEEIREIELTLISRQYAEKKRELEELGTQQKGEQLKRETSVTAIRKKESESEKLKLELMEMEKQVQHFQQLFYQHQQKIHQLENMRELKKKEIEQWSILEKKDQQDVQHIEAKREQTEKSLKNVIQALAQIIRQEEGATEGVKRQDQEIESEIQKLSHLGQKIEQEKKELLSLVTELTTAHHRLLQFNEKRGGIESQTEELSEEEEALNSELKKFKKEKSGMESAISKAAVDQKEIQHQKNEAELRLKHLKESHAEGLKIKEEVKERVQCLNSRIQSLEELSAECEGDREGIKCFSDEEKKNFRILGTLADLLEIDAQYEKALEAVFENRLKAGIVEAIIPSGSVIPSEALLGEARDLEPLFEKVRVQKEVESAVRLLLKDTYVVSDFKKGFDIWSRTPGLCTFVTKEGELITSSGLLFGGKGEGRAKGILSRKREKKELLAERADFERKRDESSSTVEQIEARIIDISNQIEQLQQKFHESQMLQTRYESDLLKSEENIERILGEKEGLADEKNDQTLLKEQLLQSLTKEEALGRSLEEKKKVKEASLDTLESTHQKIAVAIEARKKAFTELQVTQASLRERRGALERQKEHLDLNLKTILSEIDEKREAVRLAIERQKAVAHEVKEDEERLQRTLKEFETQKEALTALKIAFDQKNLESRTLEDDLRKQRSELHKIEALEHEQQLKRSQAEMTRTHLSGQVREKYLVEIEEVYERYQERPLPPEDQQRLVSLKEKANQMGEVNLTAIGEFEELKGRYDVLNTQKQDLIQSMESLKKTIEKINRISRERFQETFERVNENFKKLFPILFGGGRAELVLSDPENLLETGLDIMTKPPGKKHQNINLLSGGEKALTAVSLIFAAFLMRPSPFCLLDEVDAPLDDMNVGRFNEMIRQMTKHSQFIVITHNKKTMEMADVLYGVTMETPGVSMMVSVKLDRAIHLAEPPLNQLTQ